MPGGIITILGMIRFSHTVFALPFAILGAFLAGQGGLGGFCGWQKLLLVVLCMVWARSTAMAFNRIADAAIDGRNQRTAAREIPTGKVSRTWAWWFCGLCAVLFAGTTVLFWQPVGGVFGFGNHWPLVLSGPALVLICSYSYAKRFTWASHFWLGASLMLGPVGAWVAVSPPEGPFTAPVVWALGGAVVLWTAGFDIIYACQDVEVDRREGLFSLPARLGPPLALWVSRTCHSLAVTLLLLVGMLGGMGSIYLAGVGAAGLLLVAQHWLMRKGQMQHIKIAFGTVNAMVSIVVGAAGVLDILIR